MPILRTLFCAIAAFALTPAGAWAEPYLAVRNGTNCIVCHVNPTGGGKRNEFGAQYGVRRLSESLLGGRDGKEPATWDGRLNDFFALGADLRGNLNARQIRHQADQVSFDLERAGLYADVSLIGDRLTLYVDEQFAPGGTTNREAYGLFWFAHHTAYVKAGRMFLPYGWRLEDDTAFTRRVPGINFTTPDTGIETGLEHGPWSVNLALTNGTAGGAENNKGKQVSLRAAYMHPGWSLGGSVNYNSGDNGRDRRMQNLFAGLQTGSVTWLAQGDYIIDDTTNAGRVKQWIGFLEANVLLHKGHNLKLSFEHLDPNTEVGHDEQSRVSLVYEWFPFQYTQVRVGFRHSEGIPQSDSQNGNLLFIQLHNYF